MILLDADVFLVDVRYLDDPRGEPNRQALDRLRRDGQPLGVTTQVMLEVVGSLSFRTPLADIPLLPGLIRDRYSLTVVPDPLVIRTYSGCSIAEVLSEIGRKMSLGDAVMAAQIRLFAPSATTLLTWNAKHFRGKIAVPVLTPAEWLLQHTPAGPTP